MTASQPGRSSIGMHRKALGRRGEDLVAAWYEEAGFRLLARNWRSRDGEIDLVAARGDVLVFCEVKTRTNAAFGAPYEAVTVHKQARLRRLAAQFLALQPHEFVAEIRFDVASVIGSDIQVLEAAF